MLASILFVILVVAMMILCGRVTANFAVQKGRSRSAWFLLGVLSFSLRSIALALLPSHRKQLAAISN